MLIADRMQLFGGSCYDPLAEAHVPASYATIFGEYTRRGCCMLPAARNSDPTAKQSGACFIESYGCDSSTTLNCNIELGSDDSVDDSSCIEPSYSCTLNSNTYDSIFKAR